MTSLSLLAGRTIVRPFLAKIVYQKIIFLFLNQNICCGYSKESSEWDGSFELPNSVKTDG